MTGKRALLVAIGFVGLALFVQSLYMLGVERLAAGLRRVGWGFGVIVILSGAREAARTLAWVRTVEGPRLPFARAFRARLAGEALNTLLPMGMLVGEPVKASHVAPDLPFASAFRALVVEFAFYGVSLALLLASGTTAFIVGANPSLRPYLTASLAVSAVLLAVLVPYVRRAGRPNAERTATFNAAGGRIGAATRRAISGVRRHAAIVGGFATEHPQRVRAIVAFEIAYQVLAVTEVYFTLFLISPVQPTLATSLVLETVNRVITMLFKMLPLRLGVDEASSSLFAGRLDLGATTGLTLALVRKLRMLFWGGIGLLFLLPRRSDLTVPAWSWPVVDQRVP